MIKKRSQNPGENFRHFSPSLPDLNKIDWTQPLHSVGISAEGSKGVVYLETHHGSIVFKAADDVSVDVFTNQLAHTLNTPVPRIRIISYDSIEFKQMMRAVEKYCHNHETLYEIINRRLNRPFYQLLEYIPNIKLDKIGPQRFSAIFSNQSRLDQLGRIIGFDIVMNNSDRVPLYWNTEGNPANLLFSVRGRDGANLNERVVDDVKNVWDVEFGDIYMIDTRLTVVDRDNSITAKRYKEIMDRISLFVGHLVQFVKQGEKTRSPMLAMELFNNLNTQFYNYTEGKFDGNQLLAIGKGILLFLYDFCLQYSAEAVSKLIGGLKRRNKMWEDTYWNQALQKIPISYFEGVEEILSKHLMPLRQWLEQIRPQHMYSSPDSASQKSHDNTINQEDQEGDQVLDELAGIFDKNSQQPEQDVPSEKSQIPLESKLSISSAKDQPRSMRLQPESSNPSSSSHSLHSTPPMDSFKKPLKKSLEQKLSHFRSKNTHE